MPCSKQRNRTGIDAVVVCGYDTRGKRELTRRGMAIACFAVPQDRSLCALKLKAMGVLFCARTSKKYFESVCLYASSPIIVCTVLINLRVPCWHPVYCLGCTVQLGIVAIWRPRLPQKKVGLSRRAGVGRIHGLPYPKQYRLST